MKQELHQDLITFGKYKNKNLKDMIKDRNYCRWLLYQEWFQNYEYIYNFVLNYEPLSFFISKYKGESEDFLDYYDYFNLIRPEDLKIDLTESERACYNFYTATIYDLKQKILNTKLLNKYDIKAPQKWLKNFETETGLSREDFKTFINSYDLKNITSIVEDIKAEGGIEYKGSKSFLIAKENSRKQEDFWKDILTDKYGELISTQFKYENCFFDFINISSNTIYECKLSLKDFNEDQYNKYVLILEKYNIVYLVGEDMIVNLNEKGIYTLDSEKYLKYKKKSGFKPTYFDDLIKDFDIIEIDDLKENV